MTRKLVFGIDGFRPTENVEYDDNLVQVDIEIRYVPRKNRTIPIITFVPQNFSEKALLSLVDAVAEVSMYSSRNHRIDVGFNLITALNEFKNNDCEPNSDTFTYEELIAPLRPTEYNILGLQINYSKKYERWELNATSNKIFPIYDKAKDIDDFMENKGTVRMIDALIVVINYLIDDKERQQVRRLSASTTFFNC